MPIPVRTRPRFRCQYCQYKATLPTVERHEQWCWNNPDRYCPECDNTGFVDLGYAGSVQCRYCKEMHCQRCGAVLGTPHNLPCVDWGSATQAKIIFEMPVPDAQMVKGLMAILDE